jgi:hypothetical protein
MTETKKNIMKTLELFSGTKSFSKVAASLGHKTFTVDNDPNLEPDWCGDIREFLCDMDPDIIWASPPCQGFSVAVIGRNWNRDYTPKTDSARLSMELAQKTIDLILEIRPKYWFIENPRGMLRKMPWIDDFMKEIGGVRHTVTYCQYGDTRQKPTDILTNCLSWHPKPTCKPGSPCHEPAPRGSRTGTQGIKGAKDRGRIPEEIFKEIFNSL